MVAALRRHVSLATIHLQTLVTRRPVTVADLVIGSGEPVAVHFQRVAHKLDAPRKSKWLGIAQRYPKMKPEEQERLQRRMNEWASLTPAQRQAAREKYREFEQLPPDEREVVRKKWDEYKQVRTPEGAGKGPEGAAEKAAEAQADSQAEGAAGSGDPPSPTAEPRQE